MKNTKIDLSALDLMFKDYFIDYASYVILDRAIPSIEDGLKPVQRRILHSLKEMEDGKYNKVANVVGHAMRYHPHGDMSIKDAMVNIGQKKLFIDTQGNWGNILTGDNAAAPRYIEARLTKLALDVLFNKEITTWIPTYDSRGKEPKRLPVKFPLLLSLGTEGIAVGVSTKILPHNNKELIEACIKALKNEKFEIYPDFQTGGLIDVSGYNDGDKGAKVKIRAKIEVVKNNLLRITEIPYGTTTESLIQSIVKANEIKKIKIKRITDNTAKNVNIEIELPGDESPAKAVKALYAFTRCEESIYPVTCVIDGAKPSFTTITALVKNSAERTRSLLHQELVLKKAQLEEKIFYSSLEKIFIENKIYRLIEDCSSWEEVKKTILKGLKPYTKGFYRDVTEDDITALTEIKIKRISKYDKKKADEAFKTYNESLKDVEKNIKNITKYTINYYNDLLSKYASDWERKTKVDTFNSLNKSDLAVANLKLYANLKEGFVGTSLKQETFIGECSDMDEVICFTKDGHFRVIKVSDKEFVGKNIIHCAVYKRGDEETVYTLVYSHMGRAMIKRFKCPAITRNKDYDLTKGDKSSKVLYFDARKEGGFVGKIKVIHKKAARIKKEFTFDVDNVLVKGRDAAGNILSRHEVDKITKTAK